MAPVDGILARLKTLYTKHQGMSSPLEIHNSKSEILPLEMKSRQVTNLIPRRAFAVGAHRRFPLCKLKLPRRKHTLSLTRSI